MSRPILLSNSALRLDSRRPLELRPLTLLVDVVPSQTVDGSASAQHGLTHVQATVSGPKEASRVGSRGGGGGLNADSEKAVIQVDVGYAAFSSGQERRKRSKNDRRVVELATAIKNTFEPVISLELYPRSTIHISLLILQQDGSVLSCAINAVSLALIHSGISLSSPVCSVTLSCLHDTPLLDPCAPEESDLPTLTIACLAPRSSGENDDECGEGIGKVTLVNMETRLNLDRFEGMLRLGAKACAVISQEMNQIAMAFVQDTQDRMAGNTSALSTSERRREDGMIDGDMEED